jgi:hypothetical protein
MSKLFAPLLLSLHDSISERLEALGVSLANRKPAQVASMSTILIRLGHESLDVTLAYLKGKDAESEEAQEHANSSSLAVYA